MSHPTDGGQRVRPHPSSEEPDALPCENDQAKPDRILTTGTFNQFVKDPRAVRLSGALLDRGPDLHLGVPELDALHRLFWRLTAATGVFARTF